MNLGKAVGGHPVGANSSARAMSHARTPTGCKNLCEVNSHLQKTVASRMKWLLALLLCLGAACASAAQEVKPFVRGSHQQIISARAGKPFVITFWSLACTNCRDDLAMFGKLVQKYRGFDLVLVATDTPEQKQEIASTLRHYRLGRASLGRIESWVFADSYAERLRFEVDPQWYGELPRTYFYDAQGRVLALSGTLDYAQIERWIREGGKHG